MAQQNQDGERDAGVLILSMPKNPREEYRVYAREYKGYKLADVRVWYSDRGSDEMKPGKGISLKVSALPQVIEALQKIARMYEGQETQPASRQKQALKEQPVRADGEPF